MEFESLNLFVETLNTYNGIKQITFKEKKQNAKYDH